METNTNKKEYIICSALHYNDGKPYEMQPVNIKTGFVVLGRTMGNCIYTAAEIMRKDYTEEKFHLASQGFLTNTDRWVNREGAYVIAKEAGQIINKTLPASINILMSTHLLYED